MSDILCSPPTAHLGFFKQAKMLNGPPPGELLSHGLLEYFIFLNTLSLPPCVHHCSLPSEYALFRS